MTEIEFKYNENFIIAKDMLTRFGHPAPIFTGFYYKSSILNNRFPWIYVQESAKSLHLMGDNDFLSQNVHKNVWEIYWGFLNKGFIIPKYKIDNISSQREEEYHDFENLILTQAGQDFVNNNSISPFQKNEFLLDLKTTFPILFNESIETYLSESLKCYNYNIILASMFLLGDALEQIFIQLLNFYENECIEPNLSIIFNSKFQNNSIDKKILNFKKIIGDNIVILQSENRNYYQRHFQDWFSAFDEIRVDRNNIGHGVISSLDISVVYGYFLRIRHILREFAKLTEEFKINKIKNIT